MLSANGELSGLITPAKGLGSQQREIVMNIHLSSTLKDAIRDVLERTERDKGILDVYAAATKIQEQLPEENVALEDIISALLLGRGAIQAIEFTPRAAGILEVVMPAGNGELDASAKDGEEVIIVQG
ncbi:hypothetical protein [Taklimakanibacter deserti]|uniref:hypothetical protein n=1 Tax=Taklimakanibacter deserti TaxID=2267839 RepID=UPI0013C40756